MVKSVILGVYISWGEQPAKVLDPTATCIQHLPHTSYDSYLSVEWCNLDGWGSECRHYDIMT